MRIHGGGRVISEPNNLNGSNKTFKVSPFLIHLSLSLYLYMCLIVLIKRKVEIFEVDLKGFFLFWI